MIQFQENTQTDSMMEGWTDVIRSIPATAGGPTSITAVDQHWKFKDIEYDDGLTKNYYTTISMQKISSIHILIPIIQQTLGSHELNGIAHWPCPPE